MEAKPFGAVSLMEGVDDRGLMSPAAC